MLDWLKIEIPYPHDETFLLVDNGVRNEHNAYARIESISAIDTTDRELAELRRQYRQHIDNWLEAIETGCHSDVQEHRSKADQAKREIKARGVSHMYSHLTIEGNFIKWNQGHNIYAREGGTQSFANWFTQIAEALGIEYTWQDAMKTARIIRADICYGIQYRSVAEMEAESQNIKINGKRAGRPASYTRKTTSYFGERRSRTQQIVIYDKATELSKNRGKRSERISANEWAALEAWTKGILRIEVRIFDHEARYLSLGQLLSPKWQRDTWRKNVAKVTVHKNLQISDEKLAEMTPAEFGIYQMWANGHIVSEMLEKQGMSKWSIWNWKNKFRKNHQIDLDSVPTETQKTVKGRPARMPKELRQLCHA